MNTSQQDEVCAEPGASSTSSSVEGLGMHPDSSAVCVKGKKKFQLEMESQSDLQGTPGSSVALRSFRRGSL